MRKWLVLLCLAGILSVTALIFWYKESIYSLPTPVPTDYLSVNRGKYTDLAGKFYLEKNKPVFLHFFNPDCHCSRFNIVHCNSLVKQYGSRISFAVIVMATDKEYSTTDFARKFDLTISVITDSSLARTCVVYSTPQAVLPDNNHCLYYKGNYNKSPFCTDKKSNYAQIAINSLLAPEPIPFLNQNAMNAYGCS